MRLFNGLTTATAYLAGNVFRCEARGGLAIDHHIHRCRRCGSHSEPYLKVGGSVRELVIAQTCGDKVRISTQYSL